MDILDHHLGFMDVNELADKADEATLANNEGAALHDQDRYEEAIPYFEKALSLDPNHFEALKNTASTFNHLDRFEDALSFLNRAEKINPNDSDALSRKGIALAGLEKYCAELINNPNLKYALYSSRVSTIDKLGISEAIHQAMFKALHKLNVNRRSIILIDGKKRIEKIRLPQKGIVKGDEKIFAIACASIIAKVHRDKLMSQYDKKFLGYGFGQHKGYPTKLHKQKIRDSGPCVLHRKSFPASLHPF